MIPLWAQSSRWRGLVALTVAAGALYLGVVQKNAYAPLPSNLVRKVAQDLLADAQGTMSAIILPTSIEGSFVAELSSAEPIRSQRVLARPSKLFSHMTWLGGDYQLLTDLNAMKRIFDQYPLDTIVLADDRGLPHDQLLRKIVQPQSSSTWKAVRTYSDPYGLVLRVYTRTSRLDSSPQELFNFLQSRMQPSGQQTSGQ
jgi:hypothetical protein